MHAEDEGHGELGRQSARRPVRERRDDGCPVPGRRHAWGALRPGRPERGRDAWGRAGQRGHRRRGLERHDQRGGRRRVGRSRAEPAPSGTGQDAPDRSRRFPRGVGHRRAAVERDRGAGQAARPGAVARVGRRRVVVHPDASPLGLRHRRLDPPGRARGPETVGPAGPAVRPDDAGRRRAVGPRRSPGTGRRVGAPRGSDGHDASGARGSHRGHAAITHGARRRTRVARVGELPGSRVSAVHPQRGVAPPPLCRTRLGRARSPRPSRANPASRHRSTVRCGPDECTSLPHAGDDLLDGLPGVSSELSSHRPMRGVRSRSAASREARLARLPVYAVFARVRVHRRLRARRQHDDTERPALDQVDVHRRSAPSTTSWTTTDRPEPK